MRSKQMNWAIGSAFAGAWLTAALPAAAQQTCSCGFYHSPTLHDAPLRIGPSQAGTELLVDASPNTDNLGSFQIQLNAGTELAGNAAALAAFQRAAARWESVIADPITVTIDADVGPNIPGTTTKYSASTIGAASSLFLIEGYDSVRDRMVLDASNESTNGIVASLPTAAQVALTLPQPGNGRNRTFGGDIRLTKANAKALGFDTSAFTGADATIGFNSAFAFDYDSSDGVTPGQIDFETVAVHEIGHALGFSSTVDRVNGSPTGDVNGNPDGATEVNPTPLDLFRFGTKPTSAAEFTSLARQLTPGEAALFSDVTDGFALSTGRDSLEFDGDGQQAGHWKDDAFTGSLVGTMDPTLASGVTIPITYADLRSLDLIGYEINIPEPGTAGLLVAAAGLLALGRRRRRPSAGKHPGESTRIDR